MATERPSSTQPDDASQPESPPLTPPESKPPFIIDYQGPTQQLPSEIAYASLVVGLLSIPMLCLYGTGVLFGIVALLLGIKARKRIRRGVDSGEKMAIAGMLLGLVNIILGFWFAASILYHSPR